MASIAAFEREQIRICRVLCIFFMMSVHVDPGAGIVPVFAEGFWHYVSVVWVDALGRASVAALSFVSGYLMVRTSAGRSFGAFARAKFTTLMVPMLFWNATLVALMMIRLLLGHQPAPEDVSLGLADRIGLLTGLTGPTENLSLFFLRDLFVSSLIVHALRPALRRWPAPLLLAILVVAVGEWTAPLIFRPSILFFVAAGTAAAYRIDTLRELTRWGVVLPAVCALAAALLLCEMVPGKSLEAEHAADILRRCLLTFAALCVSGALVGGTFGGWLARLEGGIFETYLLHVNLIYMMWVCWTRLVGGPDTPSYLVFFFLSPVIAMVAGQALAARADRWPGWVQIVVRGKVKARHRRPDPGEPAMAVVPGSAAS